MIATAVRVKPPDVPITNIEILFREHQAMIFRAAYRITGSASEAEDVLQTIFLRLMQQQCVSPPNYSGEEKLNAAYLHRAAINSALDVVRRRQHAPSIQLDALTSPPADQMSRNPQTAQEESELRRLLQEAVGRLNPKSAEVFVLRYFEGLSNREIAEILETSPLVVAVMLHRARTRLRAELRKFMEVGHEA